MPVKPNPAFDATGAYTDAETAALLFGLARAQILTLPLHQLQEAVASLSRAFDYYVDAGDVDRAVAVADQPLPPVTGLAGATQLISRALALVPPDSPEAGRLQSQYGVVMGIQEGDYEGAQEALGRALAIAQGVGDVTLEMRTLIDSLGVNWYHFRFEECVQKSRSAIELAIQLDDLSAEVVARICAWCAQYPIGEVEGARIQAPALLAAAERLRAVAESLVQDDLEGMQKALERMDRLLDREEVAGRTREDAEGDRQAGAREDPEDEDGAEAGGGEEQDGETPGEGEDAESRVARAQEGGEQASREGESHEGGRPASPEGEESSESRGDSQGSSRVDGSRNDFDPRGAMRDFVDRGYQDWLRDLRDAETLLPPGTQFRTEVTRIRERIEMFRRDWRARALAPQYDLFLEVVARPLEEAADRLQHEIEKSLSKTEFLLLDDCDIPDRYKERVANYFKRLSDAEGAR